MEKERGGEVYKRSGNYSLQDRGKFSLKRKQERGVGINW